MNKIKIIVLSTVNSQFPDLNDKREYDG